MRAVLFALATCVSLGSICTIASADDIGRGMDRGRDDRGFGIGTGIGIGIGIGEAVTQQATQPGVRRGKTRKDVSGKCLANVHEVKGSIPTKDLMNCYADPGDKCTGSCKLKDAAGSDVSQPAKIDHLTGSAYSCECQ
jgi:hypothetical protein